MFVPISNSTEWFTLGTQSCEAGPRPPPFPCSTPSIRVGWAAGLTSTVEGAEAAWPGLLLGMPTWPVPVPIVAPRRAWTLERLALPILRAQRFRALPLRLDDLAGRPISLHLSY